MGSVVDVVFERACSTGLEPVRRRVPRLARVRAPASAGLDAGAFGRRSDGTQRVLIEVAGSDGGFLTTAATPCGGGPALSADDLVLWTPTQDEASLNGIDLRPLLKGYVVARVLPGPPPARLVLAHAWA